MVGMRDVAKAAGVSLSTVSLVVNNTGYVSADMRAKVESAMRQLNYIPNELARNLYRNRTNTIGVIMPTIAHPFFSTLTAHLQREFAARDLKNPALLHRRYRQGRERVHRHAPAAHDGRHHHGGPHRASGRLLGPPSIGQLSLSTARSVRVCRSSGLIMNREAV